MIDHNALVTAMMCYSEQQFIRALRKDPERRSMQVREYKYKIMLIISRFSSFLVKVHEEK